MKLKTKTKKQLRQLKWKCTRDKKRKYLIGGDNATSPITKYFYYSSHNTELITMQIKGTCSSCVIQDFINNTYSIGGCIEFDLRFVNYNTRTISIDHYCAGKGLDFESVLTQIISLYGSDDYKGVKYPLIISIDANGISEPANKKEFAVLWNEILTKCFADKYSNLRPDIEITTETLLQDIMGKILFRWAYNDKPNVKKNLYKSEETTGNISRINITKDISVTNPVLKGKKTIISTETINSKLVRLYPKTPIIKGAFNYDFTYYMLQGIQINALNLGHNDKYTHAYNEFFKYDKVIHIPESIRNVKLLQSKNEPAQALENEPIKADNILECVTNDSLHKQINDILQTHTGDITFELNKEIIDLVTLHETCKQEEAIKVNEYLELPKTFETKAGTYTLSKINNVIQLSKITKRAGRMGTESFVGGGEPEQNRDSSVSDTYSITLDDTTDIKSVTAYNMFFYNNSSNIYTHFTNDMNIFNILYMKVSYKGNIYIGCINLSKKSNINLTSEIPIQLFRKTDYIKSIKKQTQIKKNWPTLERTLKAAAAFKGFKRTLTRKLSRSPSSIANSRTESPTSSIANSRTESPTSSIANSRAESPTLFMNNSRAVSPMSTLNNIPESLNPESLNNNISLEKCIISPDIIEVKVKLNKIELNSEV